MLKKFLLKMKRDICRYVGVVVNTFCKFTASVTHMNAKIKLQGQEKKQYFCFIKVLLSSF